MFGFFRADRSSPATTAAGPRSPPIASTEMIIRPADALLLAERDVIQVTDKPPQAVSSSRSISSAITTISLSL